MPSVRELAARVDRAPSTVQQHLDALVRKGWLRRDGSAHGLHLTQPGTGPAGPTIRVPLAGLLSHRERIRPPEAGARPLSVPTSLADPGAFALRVRGDSLTGAHLLDGDVLLLQPVERPTDGVTAVAVDAEGRATVGAIRWDPGPPRLEPAVPGEAAWPLDTLLLQGQVTALLRTFPT